MERSLTDEPDPATARHRFLEAALDLVHAGIIVVKRDGHVAFANRQGRALLANGVLASLDGRPLEPHQLPVARALDSGRADAQLLVHETDGGRDLLISEASPIRDNDGAVIGAVAAFVDAVPHDLQNALDAAPVGVVVLRGPELVYEYVNPAFQAISPGVSLVGRPFVEASWELPDVHEKLKEVWATGETWRGYDLSFRVERADGQPLEEAWFSFVCQRVRRRYLPDALLAFVIETTPRVRTRRELDQALEAARQRAAELQAILDTMLEGVVAYDKNRHISMVNATARRMLEGIGVTPELLQNAEDTIRMLHVSRPDGRHVELSELPVDRALRGEASRVDLKFWNPVAQRHGYASIGAAPIRDCDGDIVGVVSVGSDVTEEMQLDRLKEEFIRVIAHELKTPITIMKANTQVLAQTLGPELAPPYARMMQAIGRGADRINRIMCELLDAQQIDLGIFKLVIEEVDLPALVEEVVDRVAATSPRHRVRVVAAQASAVRADSERLREVMRILLDNAVRYSPDGGDIDVSVTRDGGEATVTVRDYGVGVPADRRERLFQRFYRAHTGTPHDYGGTGLGLYVARHIAERHGGTLTYQPGEDGRGSVFIWRIPLEAER